MADATEQSVVYGQRLNKSRCLVPVVSNVQNHRFLVGTTSLNSENEVHLLDYFEEKMDVWCSALFPHKYEIWNMSSCPFREDLLFTVYNTGKEFKASLWKLHSSAIETPSSADAVNEDEENNEENEKPAAPPVALSPSKKFIGESATMDSLATFDNFQNQLHSVLWQPTMSASDRVITVDSANVKEWRVDSYDKGPQANISLANEFNAQRKVNVGKWNLHSLDVIGLGCGSKIIQYDLRSKKYTDTIDAHEKANVLDLEYNPYSTYHMVSGGDDGKVKCWDIRNKKEPLRVLVAHSHWVTNVKFNPNYDQLLLSSSTDSTVNLWNLPTIAAKQADDDLDENEDENNEAAANEKQTKKPATKTEDKDSLIKTIDEHEESVYSVAWSPKNGWVFGSVSYDGRVLMHHVPKQEQYKILKI